VPGGITRDIGVVPLWPSVSLISCVAAIYSENKKSFIQPIQQLQNILDEFKQKMKGAKLIIISAAWDMPSRHN